ncbi:MAG: IS30 family transposase [Desulfuromonadales bacterium]|nr:IS30 family transposase [Desulfuromonadales bacterium]
MGRPGLSDADKAELWRRWKEGQTLSEIGRALGKHAGSIHGVLSLKGGIYPAKRKRSRLALTLLEREEISRGIAASHSIRQIAKLIGRDPSTVSREIHRHGGVKKYRATDADFAAWERARRPKLCRLATNDKLRRIVAEKLSLDWSPEQVAGWLKVKYTDNAEMRVSHETIYRSLFIQARGVLKKELIRHLRSNRTMRRSKYSRTKGQVRGQIVDGVSIRERPAEIEDRAIPGHWEGDLIAGSNNTHIATLVERQSRYTVLVKVEGKDTASVVSALIKEVENLPSELCHSLTWDRGMELAQHKRFTVATGIQVYFCDPQSPWQRGTNENTNRLLRQYFPKKTDLSIHSQEDLNRVAKRLNQRPRKTLDFRTPAEKLWESVALTS